MKKYFFITIFLIVNLFFLYPNSLYNDGNIGEYSPYSSEYNQPTYSPFSYEGTNNSTHTLFFSEVSSAELRSFDLYAAEAQGSLPPGYEDFQALGIDLPVGNLIPLLFFSGIYICRIILKKKKTIKSVS